MAFDTGPGAWLVVIGGAVGVVGAFILAVDKGALTLVLTAFVLSIGMSGWLVGRDLASSSSAPSKET